MNELITADEQVQKEIKNYDSTCQWLTEVTSLSEALQFKNQSVAMKHYSRAIKEHELVDLARKYVIRAERQLGIILASMPKAKGGAKDHKSKSSPESMTYQTEKTLADIGISNNQSSRFQKLAKIPDDEFEEALDQPDATTTSIISAHEGMTLMTDEDKELFSSAKSLERTLTNNIKNIISTYSHKELFKVLSTEAKTEIKAIINDLNNWVNS